MERMRSADVYDVNRRVGQHRSVVVVDLERSPILSLQLFFILLPSRTDGCDLSPRNLVECRDVRPGDPAQSDYANVDVIHWCVLLRKSVRSPAFRRNSRMQINSVTP